MEQKTYKTYRQQLAKLRSRGMVIKKGSQGSHVMRILEQENYYNVIMKEMDYHKNWQNLINEIEE